MIRRSSTSLARTALIGLMFLLGLGGGSAWATLYDFSYTGTTVNITAVIDATSNGNGSYTASSATGAWNGSAISLISTTGLGWGGNDNVIYPGGQSYTSPGGVTYSYFVNYNGIAFQAANGDQVNVYFDNGSSNPVYQYSAFTSLTGPNQFDINGTVTLSEVPAPGPIPGDGLLSLAGLGLCGLGARLRVCVAFARAMRERLRARLGGLNSPNSARSIPQA